MSHPELSHNEIWLALRHVIGGEVETGSFLSPFRDLDSRRAAGVSHDSIDVTSVYGLRTARTTALLKGKQGVVLRKGSIIEYESFVIPEDISRESVEHLVYKRQVAKVAFSMLKINEISVLQKDPVDSMPYYFVDYAPNRINVAVDGLERILNYPPELLRDNDTLGQRLKLTRFLVDQIREEERSYIDTELMNVLKRSDDL